VAIQFNESHHNRTGGQIDGGGFDLDHNTSNSIMQYNYSHDNEGAGFLLAQSPGSDDHTDNIVRYNISENDARKSPRHSGLHVWGAVRNLEMYNNTVFTSGSNSGTPRAVSIVNKGIPDRHVSGIHVRNNIIQTTDDVTLVEVEASQLDGASDIQFQGNLYYPTGDQFRIAWGFRQIGDLDAWRATAKQERVDGHDVGLVADPKLAKPGTGITLDNPDLLGSLGAYWLQDGSPAVDAGIDLAAVFGLGPVSQDFYGSPVPQGGGYDIGAHEQGGRTADRVLPGPLLAAAPADAPDTEGGSRYQAIMWTR
jgi:hypothetical protein